MQRTRTSAVSVAVLFCGIVPLDEPAHAQLPMLPGITEQSLVAAAELEGAQFPRERVPPRMLADFVAVPKQGTIHRRCVRAADSGPARSGEFIIGAEVSGRAASAHKIWWAPLHASAQMILTVRAHRVGIANDTVRVQSSDVAWRSDINVPIEMRDYFFPLLTPLAGAGTFVVVATQGADWGCFILTFR